MTTVKFHNSKASIPDFESVAQSVKTIQRSVPASSDGAYTYFADQFKLASTLADKLDKQITDALTSLPSSLSNMKVVSTILAQIHKIDEAERANAIATDQAATARLQLQSRLGSTVSSTITDFNEVATNLSEPADRLSTYAQKIEGRLKDAVATETSNQSRAKDDVKRASERLETLEARYETLKTAVDEARGGPTEDLVELIPDKDELASLVDVGAADAAAPEVAIAKKSIQLAVEQIKKILALVDKTIKFTQLTELRDEIFKAVKAQRSVTEAAQEHLRNANATLTLLETFETTGVSMASLATEINKLVTVFSNFATMLQNLEGQEITAGALSESVDDMAAYLDQARDARNNIILT